MAIVSKSQLKNWFRNGLKPVENHFWNWMDSFWHKGEKIPTSSIDGLESYFDSVAITLNSLSNYAQRDAQNLDADDVISWQEALEIGGSNDVDVKLTQPHELLGLDESNNQSEYNAASEQLFTGVLESLGGKLDAPEEVGDPDDFPFIVGMNGDGDTAQLPSTGLGKNIGNSDLTISEPRVLDTDGKPFSITNLPDKSADATFIDFLGKSRSGQIAKVGYQAFKNQAESWTPAERLQYSKLFSGQYSMGNIVVTSIIMPVIEIGDNPDGISMVSIYGENLMIDPDISYVRIKDKDNTTLFEDCTFNLIDSNRLEVYFSNTFLQESKEYVFELKHGIQVYTTTTSILVVDYLDNVDLSNVIYTKTEAVGLVAGEEVLNGSDFLTINVEEGGKVNHSVLKNVTNNMAHLRDQPLVKVRTNPLLSYNDNFVAIIDFEWNYITGLYEFPAQYDLIGLAKCISNYSENDVSNNIVAGAKTGYQTANSGGKRTGIIGGAHIVKDGIGQAIIIKKDNLLTTTLFMNGSIIRYSSNATITEQYCFEFLFVGRYLNPKRVGEYRITQLSKF